MSLIAYIIALLFTGLIVGALARLALPGRDPMSIVQTILVGIAGSFAAGLVYALAFHRTAAASCCPWSSPRQSCMRSAAVAGGR